MSQDQNELHNNNNKHAAVKLWIRNAYVTWQSLQDVLTNILDSEVVSENELVELMVERTFAVLYHSRVRSPVELAQWLDGLILEEFGHKIQDESSLQVLTANIFSHFLRFHWTRKPKPQRRVMSSSIEKILLARASLNTNTHDQYQYQYPTTSTTPSITSTVKATAATVVLDTKPEPNVEGQDSNAASDIEEECPMINIIDPVEIKNKINTGVDQFQFMTIIEQ